MKIHPNHTFEQWYKIVYQGLEGYFAQKYMGMIIMKSWYDEGTTTSEMIRLLIS